jgi:hypothetical protein
VGPVFAETEFTPETEAQAAWADYVAEHGPVDGEGGEAAPAGAAPTEVGAVAEAPVAEAAAVVEPAPESPAPEAPVAEAPVAEPATEG